MIDMVPYLSTFEGDIPTVDSIVADYDRVLAIEGCTEDWIYQQFDSMAAAYWDHIALFVHSPGQVGVNYKDSARILTNEKFQDKNRMSKIVDLALDLEE